MNLINNLSLKQAKAILRLLSPINFVGLTVIRLERHINNITEDQAALEKVRLKREAQEFMNKLYEVSPAFFVADENFIATKLGTIMDGRIAPFYLSSLRERSVK